MKKLTIPTGLLLAFVWLGACKKSGDFLDKKTSTNLNEASTFSDSAKTMDFLTGIYADIGFSFNPDRWEAGGHAVVSNESEPLRYVGPQNDVVIMVGGAISPQTTDASKNVQILNNWLTPYRNIRRVNLFLSKVDASPLSPALRSRVKGEARFLRAWYYSILLKYYGGVPLIGDKVYEPADNIVLSRATYADCVNYVTKECDEAAALLPGKGEYPPGDYGRITSGACLALKARVLLYAASPLFNGGRPGVEGDLKSIVSYPDYSPERWNKAAEAAQRIISLGWYNLFEDNTTRAGYGFYKVFHMRAGNDEYILPAMRAPGRDMEGYWLPPTRGGNYSSVPTQATVDMFDMKNGLPITDPASGYSPAQPYKNRDPRFDNSILYNGAPWFFSSTNKKDPINATVNATDGWSTSRPATTSYYIRKMLYEDGGGNTERCWPLIRYVEILLGYAEARNEYSGPSAEVYGMLTTVRKRAGITPGADNLYGLKASMSKEEMRKAIHHERMIELMFEEHKLWDARRWLRGEELLQGMAQGVKVTAKTGGFNYELFDIRMHVFRPNFYLFPIPEGEIARSPTLKQNPGW
ncbi:MAG TPA: RagB/SusD family nutrient uptake outer membrane protein [Chitinophaga sp.]|uniref:RagB/SusD family nutrient uptake outer membrane protein n=1 Tax=Chitinophaga sp. TaxID=1869181 RepID=UPI002CBF2846|nr:RagB/SusD family nutrient uptake outer membrane protein [Chitinophaga sp.]HVI45265.1 RagB/SusD family nutrient uptake outer membrane protein [Chitinophaga sp.]